MSTLSNGVQSLKGRQNLEQLWLTHHVRVGMIQLDKPYKLILIFRIVL